MGIADQKPLNMTSRGICNESYWQTINVVDTCRKRATKPAAKVIAKARHAWNGDGEEGTTVKTFHSISSPEDSSTQFKVFVQKQAWNKTSCNAQDQEAMNQILPHGPSPLDEPANPDISKSCRSSLATCVVHPCINVQNSGGQTCSMYEPHIVKPTLQRTATLKLKTTNIFICNLLLCHRNSFWNDLQK